MTEYLATDIPFAETWWQADWVFMRCPHCEQVIGRPPSWFPLRGIQNVRCSKCIANYRVRKPKKGANDG